jgi:hypothetical protein
VVCVSIIGIIQREVGMRVDIIQREGCMRVNEYSKYELFSCVSVMQREGAGTCCWHASALSVRAVGMCQHDTTQEHVSELVACVSVMQRRRVRFPLTLRTCFCCDIAES